MPRKEFAMPISLTLLAGPGCRQQSWGALFTLVIVQIDDLDRPMRGLILVQQTSLETLQGSLK